MPQIHIRTRRPFGKHVNPRLLRQAARQTLAHESAPANVELTILVADDLQLQSLNARFRGVDAPTDVLSFGQVAPAHAQDGSRVDTPEALLYLGDVVISYPRAQEQAASGGHTVQDELSLLVVHGVLHLLGHDHARRADKKKMWTAQQAVLNDLGARVTVPAI